VLAEKLKSEDNHLKDIARQLLAKVPKDNHKKSYGYDRRVFHYMIDDGLTALCVTDEQLAHRVAFAFLGTVKDRFRGAFANTNWGAAPENFYSGTFSRVLEEQMDFFMHDPNADKLRRVKGEIEQVKTAMIQNLDKALERGDQIETLVDRTSNLEAHATVFKKSATTLERKLWWKNAWLCVLLVILLVVLLGVGIVVILWREDIIHFPHAHHSPGSSSSGSTATTGSKSSSSTSTSTTGGKSSGTTTTGAADSTTTTGKSSGGGSNDGATTGKSSATVATS